MPRALIASGCPIATTTLYRCIHLQEQLAANGIDADVRQWADPQQIDAAAAEGCDLIVLYRLPMTAALRLLIDQSRSRGAPVIFDTDDLVFEPHMTGWHRGVERLSPTEQELYADGVQRYLAALEASDYVTVATPFLAGLVQRRGKPVFVHRNALGREMSALADALYAQRGDRSPSDRVVIGYGSGTPTHDYDFAEAAPALAEILARHPAVELWLAGPLELPPLLNAFAQRIRRHPLMDWQGWFRLAARFDINLAPLEAGNLFCRAKSEIKFVEAGALGIPTVASPADAFVDAIRPGENGLLASGPQAWYDALQELVQDRARRIALGEEARRSVLERYSPAARARDLHPTIDAILHAAPNTAPTIAPNTVSNTVPRQPAVMDRPMPELTTDAPATQPARAADEDTPTPLVLNWLVSEPMRGSGGHTGIFRLIRYLTEFGHECHIYILPVIHMHDYSAQELRQFVDAHFMVTGAHFHRWTGKVQEADATFATYWKTVRELDNLPNTGRRYYFVQDFEPFFYPMGTEYLQAENTYRRGLHCLTLGPWLAGLLRTRYSAQADHFDFAVNTDIYYPRERERSGRQRVAFYARPSTPRRAYEIGIDALRIVKSQLPNVEIVMYGADSLDPPPPFAHTNAGILNDYELAALYSSCDAGLSLSTTNPSLVPFEMMACRCPVVDLRNEQMQTLVTDGETALLADPAPEALAQALMRLLQDPVLRAKVVEQGYVDVARRSWRDSARQVEAVLLQHAPPPAERVLAKRRSTGEIPDLLWQINRLLDADEQNRDQLDQLRAMLYRALAEKAQMAAQIRRAETFLSAPAQSRSASPVTLPDAVIRRSAPAWAIGREPASVLPLPAAPVRQTFRADRSHLRRLELMFAELGELHAGTVRIRLYAGPATGKPLLDRTVTAAELPFDAPYALTFAPQTESYRQMYTLEITAGGDAAIHGCGVWRLWRRKHEAAALWAGDEPLRGQLAFQTLYALPNQEPQPGRSGPRDWGGAPRSAGALAWAAARRAVAAAREALRLARRAQDIVRTQGPAALLAEAVSYLRWRGL